jgi:peptide/nickel transport system substrate-binding protein
MNISNKFFFFAGSLIVLASSTALAQPATPVQGGTLKIAVNEAPVCIDPIQITNFTALNIGRNFSATLTDQDPVTGEVGPWLAKRWEVNADATAYTYYLRDDVTFADGTKLTAQSVKNNIENIRNVIGAKANRGYNYLSYYKDADLLDEHTIRINFSKPSGHFLTAASSAWLTIYADSTLAKTAEQRCAGEGLVSAGPFNLTSWSQLEGAVLERRPDYAWSAKSSANQGPAHLDKVEFTIAPEDSVRSGLLRSGEVQFITAVGIADEEAIVGEGYELLVGRNPGIPVGLQFNTQSGFLTDKNVRRALVHAVNRDDLVGALLSSKAEASTGVLVDSVPGYVDLSKEIAYDPTEAGRLLDEAGWAEKGGDGIRVKDGKPLVVTLTLHSNNRDKGEFIQQQLKDIGVDLQLTTVPDGADVINDILNPHKFEIWIANATEADPDLLRSYYGPDYRNIPNTKDEWLREAAEAQLAIGDPAQRAAKVAEIQRHVIEEAYSNPLYPVTQVSAHSAEVKGSILDVLSRLRLEAAWVAK